MQKFTTESTRDAAAIDQLMPGSTRDVLFPCDLEGTLGPGSDAPDLSSLHLCLPVSLQPPKSMLFRDSQLPEALLHLSRCLSANLLHGQSMALLLHPGYVARVGIPSGFHLLSSPQNWSLELSISGFQ